MILLCSDGITSPALEQAIEGYIPGAARAALVVTADPVYKAENYHVPRCVAVLQRLGLQVDLFDLDIQAAAELLQYDVVELLGGNPFYLLDAIERRDAAKVLSEIGMQRVLIGWSAGAMVLTPSIGIAQLLTPEQNIVHRTDLRGLGLANFEVLPHYAKMAKRYEGPEARCRQYERETGSRVLRLDDGEGILLSRPGGQERMIGKDGYRKEGP